MQLSDYTPMLINEYVKQPFGHWDGQTRVSDNHSWSCVTLADGRKVRTQGQLVPDSLLSAEDLEASNAVKHKFDVVYNGTTYQMTEYQAAVVEHLFKEQMNRFGFSLDQEQQTQMHEDLAREELALAPYVFTEQGERVLPEQVDMDKAQAWMDANPEADAGSHAEMFQGLTQQYLRERLAQPVGPRPFTDLASSFDVLIAKRDYVHPEMKLTFEYRISDVTGSKLYDLSLDGEGFDGCTDKPENLVTGLVNKFGYGLRFWYEQLPEVLHQPVLRRIGQAVWPEREPGAPYQEPTYRLLDERYTRFLKWSSDPYQVAADQAGESYFKKLVDAGFTSTRAASAAKFAGSLVAMNREEQLELLTLLGLQVK